MADKLKFKNRVNLVGTINELDVRFEEKEDKRNGETYDAAMGNIVIDTGNNNLVSLSVFQRDKFGNGNENATYKQLKNWKQMQDDGTDLSEVKLGMSTSIGMNVFVAQDGSLVETTNIQAGFIDRKTPAVDGRSEFSVELVLSPGAVTPEIRDDVETGRAIVRGELVAYNGVVYPARFIIEDEGGANYLADQASDGPIVLDVWGKVINSSETTTVVEESAFGAPREIQHVKTRRENLIVGAALEPREMTEEIAEAIKSGRSAYEVHKAEVAAKENSKKTSTPQPKSKPEASTGAPKKSGFNF